jgi:hypothetical protein
VYLARWVGRGETGEGGMRERKDRVTEKTERKPHGCIEDGVITFHFVLVKN